MNRKVFVAGLAVMMSVPAMAQGQAEKKAAGPLVKITPAQQAKLDKKKEKIKNAKPFDQPDEAMEFYANSRTGPVITRGANIPASRPLSPGAYLPAIQAMRSMPVINSSTKQVGPASGAGMGNLASPGAALNGWSNVGPNNQGGRTRALLIDPNTPTTMYAGGVDGGVWKTTNGGGTWTTGTDLMMSNLAVVTLAFQPGNTNVMYAGTGEGVGNFDAIRGAGIFKTTDGGTTWTQLASTNTSDFHYTMKVLVSPRNPQRVWAATRTGVWRSLDGGATWTNTLLTPSTGCTDMVMQEKRTIGFIYVSCGRTSGQGTVWRAVDANTGGWTSILTSSAQGRSALALAPSNESILYVLSSQRVSSGGPGQFGLLAVYRSTANGNPGSFTTQRLGAVAPANTAEKINQLMLSNPVIALLTECGFGTSSFLNQGWYDNVIAVDPVDPNRVWAGGIDLWRSDDGGVNWGTASYWWFDKGVDPEYAHADQHGIVFHPGYNGTSNKVMFVASDGGIARTDDARAAVNTTLAQICGAPVAGGTVWVDRNTDYVTTQFYDGTVYPNANGYFGGMQDNGTQRGVSVSLNWSVLAGGDGGYTALNTLGDMNPNNDILFLENTGKSMQRSTNGGTSFSNVSAAITGTGFLFIAPFAMNQTTKTQLWYGGFDIWRTTDSASTWTRATGASGTCGTGSISAFATHPLDGNLVLVGMSDGCYHYNTAALSAPNTGVWPGGSFIGSGFISWMAWDPNNTSVAYATVSNFTATTILKTTNGGVSWTASQGTGLTALPAVPARTVVVNPADSNEVYVGTDLGVFTSVDAGATWYRENTTFANVSVNALKINETPPYKLTAFTHGRGAWVTNLATNGVPVVTGSK